MFEKKVNVYRYGIWYKFMVRPMVLVSVFCKHNKLRAGLVDQFLPLLVVWILQHSSNIARMNY
jgi:hypothetical protein